MPIQFTVTEQFSVVKEKVFDGLTDLDGARDWMKGLVRIEKIKGEKVETGAVWRETRKMFGKEATEEFEVTSVIQNKEIRLRVDGTKGSSKKGEYLFQYLLTEKNGGTAVTLNGEIAGLKGFSALFGKLFAGMFKKACRKDLRTLKQYLESNK
ncbi:MAG: SRPBCC family protein [Chitinophagaceae bacterium]|nr:SRPBCC family protein [Chitinophagaceae bacterium]